MVENGGNVNIKVGKGHGRTGSHNTYPKLIGWMGEMMAQRRRHFPYSFCEFLGTIYIERLVPPGLQCIVYQSHT